MEKVGQQNANVPLWEQGLRTCTDLQTKDRQLVSFDARFHVVRRTVPCFSRQRA